MFVRLPYTSTKRANHVIVLASLLFANVAACLLVAIQTLDDLVWNMMNKKILQSTRTWLLIAISIGCFFFLPLLLFTLMGVLRQDKRRLQLYLGKNIMAQPLSILVVVLCISQNRPSIAVSWIFVAQLNLLACFMVWRQLRADKQKKDGVPRLSLPPASYTILHCVIYFDLVCLYSRVSESSVEYLHKVSRHINDTEVRFLDDRVLFGFVVPLCSFPFIFLGLYGLYHLYAAPTRQRVVWTLGSYGVSCALRIVSCLYIVIRNFQRNNLFGPAAIAVTLIFVYSAAIILVFVNLLKWRRRRKRDADKSADERWYSGSTESSSSISTVQFEDPKLK